MVHENALEVLGPKNAHIFAAARTGGAEGLTLHPGDKYDLPGVRTPHK